MLLDAPNNTLMRYEAGEGTLYKLYEGKEGRQAGKTMCVSV